MSMTLALTFRLTPDSVGRVEQWAKRTRLAHLIIQAGINAAQREDLPQVSV